MDVFSFGIDPKDVREGRAEGEPFVRASNPCPCGCSPKTFVSLSDGKVGVTARFETDEELQQFKQSVAVLQMPHADDCRFCQHLVDKRPPRTRHYIGGCDLDLRPESCGKFELATAFWKTDPRISHK